MNVGGVSGRGGQRRAGGAILTVGWARLPSFLLFPPSPLEVPRNHGPPATLVSAAAAAASARVRSPLVPRKPATAETATEPVVEAAVVVSLVVAPSVTSAVVPAAVASTAPSPSAATAVAPVAAAVP